MPTKTPQEILKESLESLDLEKLYFCKYRDIDEFNADARGIIEDWLTTHTKKLLEAEIKRLEKEVEETKRYWHEKAPHHCSLCWEDDYCMHEIKREILQDQINYLQEEIIKIKENI